MDLNNHIYSSVDESIKEDYTKENKNKLRDLFLENKEVWLSSKDLQERCKFKTNVGLRQAITELIENEFMTIISGIKGYKYTNNEKYIEMYISSLESRIKGIEKRIRGLRNGN